MDELEDVIRKWTAEKGRWLLGNNMQPGSVGLKAMTDGMNTLTAEFVAVCSRNGTPHPTWFDSLAELANMARTHVESMR